MKKLIFAVFFCMLGIGSVWAQKTFSGKVTEDNGLGLPGVNVLEKANQTNGFATDIDGNWTLTVPNENSILIFRSIGMKTIEVKAKDAKNIVMKADTEMLDEVMVVAYGTAKRSSFTGSATVVKAEDLEKRKTSEITKALEGEVAGVQVVNTSGQPGTTAKIRIRGIGSLNASSEPLYVLDGIPFDGDLSTIDSRDIASFTVLKDASAAALYGSRAANGVVLIQTKKGKKGESKIDVNVDIGTSLRLLPYYETTDDPKEYYELSWTALRNSKMYDKTQGYSLDKANAWATDTLVAALGGYNLYDVPDNQLVGVDGKFNPSAKRMINDSWEDEMMRTGLRKSIGVNFRGGNDNSTYYSSINYLNDEGYVKESSFDRLGTVINLNHNVKPWLKTSNKLSYTYFKSTAPVNKEDDSGANNAFYFINNMPPIYPVFVYDDKYQKVLDENGDYLYDYSDGSTSLQRRFGNYINPARSYELDERYSKVNEVSANSFIEATFLEDFKFSSRIGVTYQNYVFARQQNSLFGDGKGKGSVYREQENKLTYTWNQILNWSKQFGDHNVSAMLGHEVYEYEKSYSSAEKQKTLKEHMPEFSNAVIIMSLKSDVYRKAIESYFGQVIYDYSGKYFLKGSLRRDGSSKFPNDRWGNFWSVGASWKISDETFMESYDFIDLLKLKASYGVSGNEDVSADYPTYDISNVENLNDDIALVFDSKGNPNLTWESNFNFNVGTEFQLFKKKLSGSVEYYIRNTKDLLYKRKVAGSLGYSNIYVNDLDMRNSGIEFDLSYTIFDTEKQGLTIGLNGAHYLNEITKMPYDSSTGKPSDFVRFGQFGYEEGKSIYDRYIRKYAGVDEKTGESLWWKAVDEKGKDIADLNKTTIEKAGKYTWEKTNKYGDATRTFIGETAIPDLQGGFSLNYRYDGFNFGVKFVYQLGGKAYDGIYASLMNSANAVGKGVYHKDILNAWTTENTNTTVPRITNDLDRDVSGISDRWLIDASYLGLSNIRIGYDFSEAFCEQMKINSLGIYASGSNLYTWTKRKGFYPNTSVTGSSSEYRYTPMSTFTLGLKLTF